MGGGVGTGQSQELGLIGLDGVEEGGVVGATIGVDIAMEKVNVADGRDGSGLRVVAGGERGVVAIDDRARGGFDARSRGKMQGDAGVDIEWVAEIDGTSFIFGFAG